MCGLPAETDADVLQIAEVAKRVIDTGRSVSRHRDIRCTVSIGGFSAQAAYPFPVGRPTRRAGDGRPARATARGDPRRSPVCQCHRLPVSRPTRIIEGLLSRGDRRVGRVIERVWREGVARRVAGVLLVSAWSAALAAEAPGIRRRSGLIPRLTASADRPRSCPGPHELRPGQGLVVGRLAGRAGGARERDNCTQTVFDCGVCPQLGTHIRSARRVGRCCPSQVHNNETRSLAGPRWRPEWHAVRVWPGVVG